MKKKLTFKEYLESKERLLEAIKKNPHQTVKYDIRRYCKFVIGESKDKKQAVNLKPKQFILVEWLFATPETPTIQSVKFENVSGIDPNKTFAPFWSTKKTRDWLNRNTQNQN